MAVGDLHRKFLEVYTVVFEICRQTYKHSHHSTPTHFYTKSQPPISINSNAARTPPPALSYNNHLPTRPDEPASLAPNPGPD